MKSSICCGHSWCCRIRFSFMVPLFRLSPSVFYHWRLSFAHLNHNWTFVPHSPFTILTFPGAAGISHLLAETDFLRTRLIQHSVSIREGWNDRFLNDIRMVLRMQYKLDDASGLSVFLHNLFYRHTVTFLSPFRHCLRVFREEVFASPHRRLPSISDTQILTLPPRFFFGTQMNGA